MKMAFVYLFTRHAQMNIKNIISHSSRVLKKKINNTTIIFITTSA